MHVYPYLIPFPFFFIITHLFAQTQEKATLSVLQNGPPEGVRAIPASIGVMFISLSETEELTSYSASLPLEAIARFHIALFLPLVKS